MKKIFVAGLVVTLILALAACSSGNSMLNNDLFPSQSAGNSADEFGTVTNIEDNSTDYASNITAGDSFETTSNDMFTDRDLSGAYNKDECVEITLTDESQTISSEGIYLVSGSLENGQFIIDCGDLDKVQLVLNGVSISCDYSASIYVKNADKVFVTLVDGTENTFR